MVTCVQHNSIFQNLNDKKLITLRWKPFVLGLKIKHRKGIVSTSGHCQGRLRGGVLNYCFINHNMICRLIFVCVFELCRSFVMKSRVINKVFASSSLFLLPCFSDGVFPLSSWQTVFQGLVNIFGCRKGREQGLKWRVWWRAQRVMSHGDRWGLSPAHSVPWAWRVIPKGLQAEMGRREWPGFYSTESPVAAASFLLCVADFKKCTTWEFQVRFYLGPNEDYSPGEHISDSSEKQLQRGRGKVSIYVTSVNREFTQSSTYFCRRFLLVTGSRGHHEGLYCFSRCEEM